MSSSTTYDPLDAAVPNRVLGFIPHLDVPTGLPNTLVNADVSAVYDSNLDADLINRIYWLAVPESNQVVEMSAPQMALVDSNNAAALLAGERASAQADVTTPRELGKLERAAVDQLLIQLNAHTTFETALLAAIAAATSLANLQTRAAQLTTPNQITLNQAKTAIINDIASGGEGD